MRSYKIGQRESGLDALKLDTVGIHPLVAACAGARESDHQITGVAVDRRAAELHVCGTMECQLGPSTRACSGRRPDR